MAVNSKETFEPASRNLADIFTNDNSNTKCKFYIPDFQRQYSWKNNNLEELWKDLMEAFHNKDDIYFLGSIVLVKERGNTFSIIDGQQRLTTLVIMMDVLLKDFADKLDKNMVKSLKKYHSNKFTLQNNPSYDEEFEEEIRSKTSFNHNSEDLVKEKELNKTDPRYKYRNTAYFFYDKFTEYEEDYDKFLTYIFENIFVIRTICYDENFAIKMFISLNDRGLPLSNADNFKSWLYSRCTKDERASFNLKWKNLVDLSNELKITMDDFIVWYEYYLIKTNPKMNVVDVLKRELENYSNPTIMTNLLNYMKCIKEVVNPTENTNLIYSLRYIKWKAYVMSILASAYMVKYPDMTKLLKLLRKFYYIAWISNGTVNSVKNTSFRILECVVEKKPIEDIVDFINNFIYRQNRIGTLYNNLNGNVYDTDFFKPLLMSVEYQEWEDNSLSFQPLDKKLHIDHILPKKYENDSDWAYIKDRTLMNQKLNTLGNMALLQWYKNERALNKGLKKKLNLYSGYEEDGLTLIQDEKGKGPTKFKTTQILVDEYKGTRKKWTSNSIDERKNYLLTKIENMLDIKTEDLAINFDLEDYKVNRGKWEYQSKIYNNKQLIRVLLEDYLKEKNIKKFKDIPSEISKFKIYHREFLVDREDLHNRYELDINGMKLYAVNVYYTSEMPTLLGVFKKYFDFEYEKVNKDDEE